LLWFKGAGEVKKFDYLSIKFLEQAKKNHVKTPKNMNLKAKIVGVFLPHVADSYTPISFFRVLIQGDIRVDLSVFHSSVLGRRKRLEFG